MDESTKIALLKDEYLLLQKFYEDFDARAMTIKGWSATIAIAATGVGFYQTRYLWLFAAVASIVFWVLEALWKSFQYMYAPRIQVIENAFRTEEFGSIDPLQVYSSWFDTFRLSGFGISNRMLMAIIGFPHALTFLVGVILFALETLGIMIIDRSK